MKYADDIKNMSVSICDGGVIELTLNRDGVITPIETFEVDRDNPLEDDWFEFIYKNEPYDLNIWSTFTQDEGETLGATIYEVILDGDTYDTDTAEFVSIEIFNRL